MLMKKISTTLFSIFLSCCLFAQTDSSDCSMYHKGYFSYTDSLGNIVLIDRLKNYQFEKNTTTKVKIQFHIKWLSSCSYQITQLSANSKAARKFKYQTTEIKILKTDGKNGYS
jgi:hypothetical protein